MATTYKRMPRHGFYREVASATSSYRASYCELHGWIEVNDDGSLWQQEHFSCEKELKTGESMEYGEFVITRVPLPEGQPIPKVFEYRSENITGSECTLGLAMEAIDRIKSNA